MRILGRPEKLLLMTHIKRIRTLSSTHLAAEPSPLDGTDTPLCPLPLLGTVSAGLPIEAVEDPATA